MSNKLPDANLSFGNPKDSTMAVSVSNDTDSQGGQFCPLEKALDELDDVQFIDNDWRTAKREKAEVERIIKELYAALTALPRSSGQ
jgi:hypothetical protein